MLNHEQCLTYITETVFRLRPSDYPQKYPKWSGLVGLEIEMLPVREEQGAIKKVDLQGEGGSIATILSAWAQGRQLEAETTEDDAGHKLLLRIALDDGDQITFEPGGQVEFSSRPYPCLSEAVRRMEEVQALLDDVLRPHGIRLVQVGINPWHSLAELGLQMRKGRYRAMDAYFASIGEFGQRMMRQTCTVQVNLDFGPDEETLAQRYLASQLLAPVAAAIFANSPQVDGQLSPYQGFRSHVWRGVDPARTGLPGLAALVNNPSRALAAASYCDFALNAPVIFVTALDYLVPSPKIRFGDWLSTPIRGVYPTMDDFKTHLTLLFPEVRPRGFLELRAMDCLPRAWQAVPAALMAGLLYHKPTLESALAKLLPHSAAIPELLVQARSGLARPELRALAQSIMQLGLEGFAKLSACYKSHGIERSFYAFHERYTARGLTLGDELRQAISEDGGLRLHTLTRLEDSWRTDV